MPHPYWDEAHKRPPTSPSGPGTAPAVSSPRLGWHEYPCIIYRDTGREHPARHGEEPTSSGVHPLRWY